jgi:hypothetical protein
MVLYSGAGYLHLRRKVTSGDLDFGGSLFMLFRILYMWGDQDQVRIWTLVAVKLISAQETRTST